MNDPVKLILAACLGLFALHSAPAGAQNAHSWVSRSGSDSNNCTSLAPCRLFQAAYNATVAGGEIGCVNSDEFGPMLIQKSITINCMASRGSISNSGSAAGINLITAATDIVNIRGVDIVGTASTGQGIVIDNSPIAELHLRDVTVRGFADGVRFWPNNVAQLVVTDSLVANNSAYGVHVSPYAPGAANAHFSRLRAENNFAGVFGNGTGSAIGININMQDGFVTGNTFAGIRAFSGAGLAAVNISVSGTQVSGNFGPGLKSDAAASSALIRVGASMITANASAIGFSGVGQVRSFGNNQVNSNGGGETFSATDLLK